MITLLLITAAVGLFFYFIALKSFKILNRVHQITFFMLQKRKNVNFLCNKIAFVKKRYK